MHTFEVRIVKFRKFYKNQTELSFYAPSKIMEFFSLINLFIFCYTVAIDCYTAHSKMIDKCIIILPLYYFCLVCCRYVGCKNILNNARN